ncbi:MAG TPA: hypothetical protein VF763_10430 [Candidatus Limnocylindrales bacterium]
MTALLDAPTLALPRPTRRTAGRLERELVSLLVLRELEDAGALTGLDVLDRISPLVRPLRVPPASYPLLHQLQDDGFLAASAEAPPRYEVTAAGRREAERLALDCWPLVNESITRYSSRVARLFPRGA